MIRVSKKSRDEEQAGWNGWMINSRARMCEERHCHTFVDKM